MESCRLCSKIAHLEGAFCASCLRAYGPKTAAFLARGQVDPGFAEATLARLGPDARQRLLAALSRQYLTSGPGLRKAVPCPEVGHRRVSA